MKKNLLVMLSFAFVLLAVSCNKNQKAVKNLDGSWNLTFQDGEKVEEDDKLIYTFDNCKLKKDEYCTLTIEDNESKETASYKVDDDGETLVLRDEFDGTAFEYSGTITELTSTKLLLDLNVLGFVTKLEFEKL